MRSKFLLLSILLSIASFASGEVNSYYMGGVSFFNTGDLNATTDEIDAGDLSPGLDGDFLVSFRDSKRTSVLAGFGILWSQRTEKENDIPFEGPGDRARIELLGFPFTIGFARRNPENGSGGLVWGALAHYYLMKVSVEDQEGDVLSGGFRIGGDGMAERDAAGPGVSLFAAYEIPFFLGRIGAGMKGRWTDIRAEEKDNLGTPEFQLSGITLFLSIATR